MTPLRRAAYVRLVVPGTGPVPSIIVKFFPYVFIFVASFLYLGGEGGRLVRGDGHFFVRERAHYQSESEYFLHALSHNRSRHLWTTKQNVYFRPLMMGTLALEDIFAQDKPKLIAALAILLHAILTASLYYLLTFFIPQWLAFVITLPFLFPFTGVEMLLWPHITPYAFSILGICWAIIFYKKDRTWLGSGALLFSMLAHEMAAFAAPIAIVFLPKLRKLVTLPFVAYWAMNFLSLAYYRQGFNWHRNVEAIISAWAATISVFGSWLYAFLMPMGVQLRSPSANIGKITVDFSSVATDWVPVMGALFLAALLGLIVYWRKKDVTLSFLGLIYLILGLSFAWIRVQPLGFGYIASSSYYFYLTSFFLTLFVAALLAQGPRFRVSIACFFLLLSGVQAVKAKVWLAGQRPKDAVLEKKYDYVASVLNEEHCYAGDFSSLEDNYILGSTFYRKSCRFQPTKKPVALIVQEGIVSAAAFENVFPNRREEKPLETAPTDKPTTTRFLLSSVSDDAVSLGAQFQNAEFAGFLIDNEKGDRFEIAYTREKFVISRGLPPNDKILTAFTEASARKVDLFLSRTQQGFVVFKDGMLMTRLPADFSFRGKVFAFIQPLPNEKGIVRDLGIEKNPKLASQ